MQRWLLWMGLLVLLAACTPEEKAHIETQVSQWLTATPSGGGVPPWIATRTPRPATPPPSTRPSATPLPYPYPPSDTATPTPAGATNTPTPAGATDTPTPSCTGGWIWAYRPLPAEFAAALDTAFNSQFSGLVSGNLFGETDPCGLFHAMALDTQATINAPDLNPGTLNALDAQYAAMLEALKPWPAPNLGNVHLTFFAGGASCQWDYTAKSCRTVVTVTPLPITDTPTPTPATATDTPTPTPNCAGGWQWAYRSLPPEFAAALTAAFNSQFSGSVGGSLFGETDACNHFYARELDTRATINAPDLNIGTLTALDAQYTAMLESLRPWPAPYLGNVYLTFVAGGVSCQWDYTAKSCRSVATVTPTPGGATNTPTPTPATATNTPTPTPACTGGWQWATRPLPADFAAALATAFNSQFSGSVSGALFGEIDPCGLFAPMALDTTATINAPDLNPATLTALDAQYAAMLEALKPWPALHLGNVRIKFVAGGASCNWDYTAKTCR